MAVSPIMIHGLLQRTGTNLLHQLLLLHTDCTKSESPVREGWMLDDSDLLFRYVDELHSRWTRTPWNVTETQKVELTQKIGKGLLEFLSIGSEGGKHLVSKTPSVKNIDRASTLFPTAKIVILVRDGRDVAESAHMKWNRDRLVTAQQWNEAAETVAHFEGSEVVDRDRFCIVRYEDLVERTRESIETLLAFLGLPREGYLFGKLDDLPVFGSSEKKEWMTTPRTEDFNPIGRWTNWSEADHYYFNQIAGCQMHRLGYELLSVDRPKLSHYLKKMCKRIFR
ncbi:MAG: sulfotransferase [Planctomycetota bacterium]|nr:sulfotransferase [Planctomycetota bacterium]